MRRVLLFSASLWVLSCSSLEFDRGNAFPCDFSLPPGERDSACVAGDVCGSDNLCKRYIYEGPRFENVPTVPVYGPGSSEGTVLHPLVLNQQVTGVLANVPRDNERDALVQLADGSRVGVLGGGTTRTTPTFPSPPLINFSTVVREQTFQPEGALVPMAALLQDEQGRLAIGPLNPAPGMTRAQSLDVRGQFRVLENEPPGPGLRSGSATAYVFDGSSVSLVARTGLSAAAVPLTEASADVLDLAALWQPRRQWLLLLEDDAVELVERADRRVLDGGIRVGLDGGLLDLELAAELVPLQSNGGELRSDPQGRIVAALRRSPVPPADVLSTFQVNIGTNGPTLSSPWPDCRPCAQLEQVALFTPTVRGGVPAVEVVCTGVRGQSALRVIGSVALSQTDSCVTEQIDLPVPFARVSTVGTSPVQWPNQGSLLVGGKHGELWSGDTLSQLQPFFLERVPLDVTQTDVLGQPSLAALTDDYLAVLEPPQLPVVGPLVFERNGFRRIANTEIGASDDNKLLGFVHGVNGWGVTNAGTIVRLNSGGVDGGPLLTVSEGPTLVTSSDDSIRDSLGGEAFVQVDGGLAALYLVADDSLYFVPEPEWFLEDGGADFVITPDLTPEPSVPIRSLALERTTLGTNGVDLARGYLVTSRNVYEWQLGGSPARWSSRPIPLSGGQPLEVWFDRPRSALGRVGFTDGEVYTLPGGYQLVEPLPPDEDGFAGQVLDYENLGGWPVAYTTVGIFVAGWELEGSKLQNRFPDGGINRPMTWRKLTLPDGTEPWMGPDGETSPGKLFVTVDETKKVYRLLVFLDDLVVQVATHTRQ